MDWPTPLDEFTMRYFIAQLSNDRDRYVEMAREIRGVEEGLEEKYLTRAEEVARVIQQIRRQLEKVISAPPPPPPVTTHKWP